MRFMVGCLAIVCVGLVTGSALACSCKPLPPPRAALLASTAVFTGKVVAVEDSGAYERAVTIEVASAWKGTLGKTVTIRTPKDGGECGYAFVKGMSYLVYATETVQGEEKVLATTICTRTRGLAEAKEDLAELGEPKPAE